MSGYRLAPRAKRDLDDIWTFTEQTWGVAQAERYIRDIRDACEDLAAGRRCGRDVDHIRPGYMMLAVGAHFIFYHGDAGSKVDVIRILHQRMDIAARLGSA